jgi:hypothetical protein
MGAKGFFYIPTWALILLCAVSIASLGFDAPEFYVDLVAELKGWGY